MNEFRDRGGVPLPPPLAGASWAPPESFLGMPPEATDFARCPVVILPVPYEATVSYMGGARFGPRALLHASRYLETFDHELEFEPYHVGVYTLPELMLAATGPETALAQLRGVLDRLLDADKFVIMLGGEHSLSAAPILAHADRLGEGLSVLQLDAHADLRPEYEGTPFSHACVMYRVHDRARVVSVGVRSPTREERALMRTKNIRAVFAHELGGEGWIDRVVAALGDRVYITVDVDYFDPALMPATGTPEPGGGAWYPTLELLDRVFRQKRVVGCDVVELAPIAGLVAPDALAAKLVYKLIAFFARARGGGEPSS